MVTVDGGSVGEETITRRFDTQEAPEELTRIIAEGMADIKNTHHENLDPIGRELPLDALNSIFLSDELGDSVTDFTVEFTLNGVNVKAHSNGQIHFSK